MRGNDGASAFAGAVLALVRKDAGPAAEWTDYGTIQPDGALLCDRFRRPFRLGTYYAVDVLRAVPVEQLPDWQTEPGPAGAPADQQHTHRIGRSPWLAPLASGDRVAVAWTNDGVDPVVVGRVVRVDAVADPASGTLIRRPQLTAPIVRSGAPS